MKFATILACFGAVVAQNSGIVNVDCYVEPKSGIISNDQPGYQISGYALNARIVLGQKLCKMTCLEVHDFEQNLENQLDGGGWMHNPCNNMPQYGQENPYNQTACFQRGQLQDEQDNYYAYWYGQFPFHTDRQSQCENEESPIQVEKPTSTNGIASANFGWKAAANQSEAWVQWFEAESQSQEVQEIVGHLNNATQKMVDDIAADQISVARNGGKLVYHFINWVEPGSQCNSSEFLQCLYGENPFQGGPPAGSGANVLYTDAESGSVLKYNIFHRSCAHSSNCALSFQGEGSQESQDQENQAKSAARATQRALQTMAQDVSISFANEMRGQERNAMKVMQKFLTEARERYTAWGCDANCTKEHTRSIGDLEGMKYCQCPAAITITGDTRALFN